MVVQHRDGATVVGISTTFLCASLSQGQKVAVTFLAGLGIEGQAASRDKVRMAPSLGGAPWRETEDSGAPNWTRRSTSRAPERPG